MPTRNLVSYAALAVIVAALVVSVALGNWAAVLWMAALAAVGAVNVAAWRARRRGQAVEPGT